ncbi:MAG: amino acid ABC transporter substrate-binding protein [Pseudomonadota bacterium]
MKKLSAAMLTASAMAVASTAMPAQAGELLDTIIERDELICGVNTGLAGFGIADSQGNWTGFDVEYCRAVASVILGDSSKVSFVPLSSVQRFPALQAGEVDILSRNTTWTLTRDASLGSTFAGVWFYDGQGFMVRAEDGIETLEDMNGASVCVESGTTTELNLADVFAARGIEYEPVLFEALQEVLTAFFEGRCDVYTTDASALAAVRTANAPNPDDYAILPDLISKEPLGPMLRRGDDEFYAIARWVLFAFLEAEEKGVTMANVEDMRANSSDPTVQRLLGASGEMGSLLGVDNDWAYNIIAEFGNYGEMYERNITPLGLPRGLNALWTDGGIQYAPPVR